MHTFPLLPCSLADEDFLLSVLVRGQPPLASSSKAEKRGWDLPRRVRSQGQILAHRASSDCSILAPAISQVPWRLAGEGWVCSPRGGGARCGQCTGQSSGLLPWSGVASEPPQWLKSGGCVHGFFLCCASHPEAPRNSQQHLLIGQGATFARVLTRPSAGGESLPLFRQHGLVLGPIGWCSFCVCLDWEPLWIRDPLSCVALSSPPRERQC